MNAPRKSIYPTTSNLARRHAAIQRYRMALDDMKVVGEPIPGLHPDVDPAEAMERAYETTADRDAVLLGEMGTEIARRMFALYAKRPNAEELSPMLDRVLAILKLEGWDSDSLDEAAEWAHAQIGEERAWPEIFGDAAVAPAELAAVPVLLSREERDAKADKLAAICEEFGLEHSTSCYEESDGVRPHGQTFWVCKPGCATLRAHPILREREGGGAK